jgi:hypothetical protein
MTGTDCLYTSHSLSRSYLNHLVLKRPVVCYRSVTCTLTQMTERKFHAFIRKMLGRIYGIIWLRVRRSGIESL